MHFIPEGVDRTQFYPIPNADEIIRARFGFERYVLVLRLYDTPVGVATKSARDAPMPALTERGCP